MNTLSYKLGYWTSISLTIILIIWIICFTGIAMTSPLFYWTNLSDYLTYEKVNSQVFQNIAKFFMLLFGPIYVLLINCFYDYAPENKKVLVRISLQFALAFAILSCLHYFIQLTVVNHQIAYGQIPGLEHFVQANPYSLSTAIDMLGWTLFMGLSSFLIFPIFNSDRTNKVIKVAFIVNGISCLLAGIGYIFQIDVLTFVFINLGVGGATITMAIASIILFSKLLKK